MYIGVYSFAGIPVKIEYNFPYFAEFAKGYESLEEPSFAVTVTAKDIAEENKGETEGAFPDYYLETLAIYRKLCTALLDRNILLFHCSAIGVNGKAYLFTAPSGTGKSTHVRLWRQLLGDSAVMINDDKPLVRIQDGKAIVFGTPWNGKHRLSNNISCPVQAVCLLKRGEVNEIHEISAKQAFTNLFLQSYRPMDKEKMAKVISLVTEFSKSVSLFELHCNMQRDAAEVAYNAMKGE